MRSFDYIDRPNALTDLCRMLNSAAWVALDTEFMRERTYFAQACLIQLATPDFVALVDPLVLDDVRPLLAALQNRAVAKVMHSARQDLELFFDLTGSVPGPVFDTQIAAAFLGYDDQIGYAALVETISGVVLDKSQTRTDWSLRPLRTEQLRYAEADVTHLRTVFAHLHETLVARGRLGWVEAECARLERLELYANSPETLPQRIKQGYQFAPPVQQMLHALLVWREQTARSENLPRPWVARDAELVAIARTLPASAAQLASIPNLADSTVRRSRELEAVIADARAREPSVIWPAPPQLDARASKSLAQLLAKVQERARQLAISPALLATRREIERLVVGERELPVLEGWRREVLGDDLLKLLED